VASVLNPIWLKKHETASRVRQRIEAVLDYATGQGMRSGDNPARWKEALEHQLAKRPTLKNPYAAMPWQDLPAFMAELSKRDGIAAKALAFTIFTVARSGEARGMTWGELDLKAGVWTVPARRMKAGKEHRVPLTPAAIALLGEPRKRSELVFGSQSKPGEPLSDMTLTAVLKRMKLGDYKVHGFRSTFRDWAGETTPHPREVVEHALAHRIKDKAEASYARGDLFQKRRALMHDWANYATGGAGDNVVVLKAKES
jgi:integrase